MGKQKRARQKFHLASVKARNAQNEGKNPPAPPEAMETDFTPPNMNINISDDLFKGINIDLGQLEKKLPDDAVSVRSIVRSIKGEKGKSIKKKDKRKLRHSLFIQKIDSIYQEINKSKKKRKNSQEKLEENLPEKEFKYKIKPTEKKQAKVKGIKKAAHRKKAMLKDIAVFKKVLSDPEFKKNAISKITSDIEKKVMSEL